MAVISEFYKRLRDLCEERNMTVNELVKILDLSSGSPTAWKNGTVPRSTTVSKIADYFGVPVGYLLGTVTLSEDGISFSDGSGFGGGSGSGAGFGNGTGYGRPVLQSNDSYDRAVELCALYTVNNINFHDVCQAAGLDEHAIRAWKNGELPERTALKKIAEHLLVPLDFLLGEGRKEKSPTEQTLDEGTQRLIAAILELPPEKQKALADLIGVDY